MPKWVSSAGMTFLFKVLLTFTYIHCASASDIPFYHKHCIDSQKRTNPFFQLHTRTGNLTSHVHTKPSKFALTLERTKPHHQALSLCLGLGLITDATLTSRKKSFLYNSFIIPWAHGPVSSPLVVST